jgi:hypothetical protein
MEPKSENTPFQKPITFYWVNDEEGWRSAQDLDPEMQAWLSSFLRAFYEEEDMFEFDTPSDVNAELAELARLDAQVADATECPEALEWIMQAHRKQGG